MKVTDDIQKSVAIATKYAKANAMAVSAEAAIQNLIKAAESLYEITQISGDKLPNDYFNDEENSFTTQPAN